MKGNKITAISLLLILGLGLSLLLYPTLSNYINQMHQTSVSSNYIEGVSKLKREDFSAYFEAAEKYNKRLNERENVYELSSDLEKMYTNMLKIPNTDVMAILEIPSLGILLPVYHGTSDAVLQRSVGHINWSNLPIGGKNTHSILCGHSGLPSSQLFTDLDKMVRGDIFTITVLDRILTYEVDQILIVDPGDVENLVAIKGKDYCTLQTCTPYGVNTHRLLVRGHRTENNSVERNARLASEGIEIEPVIVVPILIAPLLILLVFVFIMEPSRKRNKN
ncbi:sortase A [Enterococcus sp. DIV0421]|uniref:class C sortase n=1 Tax=Enterococcus sp. DIV0421 TaxID=2774688 RepID=UPI003F1FE4F5